MTSLPVHEQSRTFFELVGEDACAGCYAYCCRMLLIPHPTPRTFLDLDFIRYMLGFNNIEMLLDSTGKWQVKVNEICRLLDSQTNRCTVHNTPRKPKVCTNFPAQQCWYKQSFTTDDPPEIILINQDAMEELLLHIRFDDDGRIIEIPIWTSIRDLVRQGIGRSDVSDGEPATVPVSPQTLA